LEDALRDYRAPSRIHQGFLGTTSAAIGAASGGLLLAMNLHAVSKAARFISGGRVGDELAMSIFVIYWGIWFAVSAVAWKRIRGEIRRAAASDKASATPHVAERMYQSEAGTPESPADFAARNHLGPILDQLERAAPLSAMQLRGVADVALSRSPRSEDVRVWGSLNLVSAINPEVLSAAAAEAQLGVVRSLRAGVEFTRNSLLLLPVIFTWLGLGKAAAVYAGCQDIGTGGRGLAQTPFLVLWQRGFRDTPDVNCDLSLGATFGLPLNSLQEVIVAVSLVLVLLVSLTIVAQLVANLEATARASVTRRLADQLRGLLAGLSTRLRAALPTEGASALVPQVSEDLRDVARQFEQQAADLTASLAQVSVSVRDELASVAAALHTSVRESSTQVGVVDANMRSLASALTEAEGNTREMLTSWQHVTVDAVASMNERLEALNATEREVSTRLASMSDKFLVLNQMQTELTAVRLERQRAAGQGALPQLAWRAYGVLLGAQVGLLALVLASVVYFGLRIGTGVRIP